VQGEYDLFDELREIIVGIVWPDIADPTVLLYLNLLFALVEVDISIDN